MAFARSGPRFWPNFAERVSRLATSQGLDGGHLARAGGPGGPFGRVGRLKPQARRRWKDARRDLPQKSRYLRVAAIPLALVFSRAAWFLPFNFRAKGHPTSPTGKEMPCKLMQGPDATPKKLEAYRMLSFILTGGAYQSSTMQH